MNKSPERYTIGRHTYYSNDLQLRCWSDDERIVIGSFCSLSDRVIICTGGQHRTDTVSTFPFDVKFLKGQNVNRSYKTTAHTVIGNDVWIGSGAMILGGVNIGNGAVIGAGSVVASDVAPYAIIGGNPAKIIRYRFSTEEITSLLSIAWWEWDDKKIEANLDWFYKPINQFIEKFKN